MSKHIFSESVIDQQYRTLDDFFIMSNHFWRQVSENIIRTVHRFHCRGGSIFSEGGVVLDTARLLRYAPAWDWPREDGMKLNLVFIDNCVALNHDCIPKHELSTGVAAMSSFNNSSVYIIRPYIFVNTISVIACITVVSVNAPLLKFPCIAGRAVSHFQSSVSG